MEEAVAGADGEGSAEDAAKKLDPKWATPRVKRLLAMEPKLWTVDLRDYF